MITLPILIVCIMLFAWKEADDDARAIAESNKTGKPFTHDDPDRYIMGIVITLILSVASLLECVTWWALLYFPITWAVFTISFRYLLNRKRGKHCLYIAPWSNKYDRLAYSILLLIAKGYWPSKYCKWEGIERLYTHGCQLIKELPPSWSTRRFVHRAGAFAYSFEALVVLIPSVTIYITKTL